MTTKEFLFGFLAGAAVGAVVTLFIAPGEGSDTRRRVSEATRPVREKVHAVAWRVKFGSQEDTGEIRQAI